MRDTRALEVAQIVREADAFIIGAGSGLTASEGLDIYSPIDRFKKTYGMFARSRKLQSLAQGLFVNWSSPDVRWAFYAWFARHEWLEYEPGPVMSTLRSLTEDKPCFVITCNVDGRFVRSGFDEDRLLETKGSVRRLVCEKHCCGELAPSDETVLELSKSIALSLYVPDFLIPRCPHCGAHMTLAIDENRLKQPDDECVAAIDGLESFIKGALDKKLVILELGVDASEQELKQPLAQIARIVPNTTYIALNENEPDVPDETAQRSFAFSGDLALALASIT